MSEMHYYLTLFPTESLIASMLDPDKFGAYMTTSSKRGSHERLVFIELDGGFSGDFDWNYAKERCVPHRNGEPKHSVYLSVYRVLEKIPFSAFRRMYLTTRTDGPWVSIKATSRRTGRETIPRVPGTLPRPATGCQFACSESFR